MKKRILCFVLTMAMVLSMLVVVPATIVSADTTVNVGTKAELEAIATAVNAGTDDYSGKTVVLTADIDLSGSTWTSIGNSSNPFRGSFNGNGHTISNMTRSGGAIGQNVGLFGVVSSPDGGSTTIQNFKITGSIVSNNGGDNAGTVVSAVKPSTTGTVTVNITGVWSAVNFDAGSAKMTGVGGILGTIAWVTGALQTTINIDSCRYSGTMDSPSAGSNDYGGIFGYPKEACGPRTVNITNCLYDGVMYLRGSAPDDNGGIVGYFKGNGGTSAETHINIRNCIVAGQFNMPNKSGQTVTGYVVSEASGSGSTGYAVTNVYYCNDSDRHSGGDMGGWYGYYKGGSGSISGLISYSNVTAKTMTELKAMTTGSNFADDSKWYFGTSSELPVPAMIYDNIIANVAPSIFDDLTQSEFTITTADELMEFASIVNAGTSTFSGKTVKLGADINLSGKTWVSIGKTRGNGSVTFRGTFDGQGHTISNMTSTVTNADGEGGLFGYVVYSATIKNFKLTGTITANNTNTSTTGYFGSIIGCVFQESATVTLQNIWSSVNVVANNPTSSGAHYAIGGLVGWIRNASGTMVLNIDSCVYDGDIDMRGFTKIVGGLIGGTNTNAAGRTVTINITNTVCAAAIHLNTTWDEDASVLIGYIKGNGGTGRVNVNLTNVISTGIFYFYTADNRSWNPASKMYGGIITSEATGDYAYVTATNLYYRSYDIPTGDGSATTWAETGLYLNSPAHSTITGGGKMTPKAMSQNLTTASFTDSSKWNKTSEYIPCPKSIVDTFGLPDSLYIEPTEIYIGTDAAMASFAADVNGGKTYAGKTVLLTADVALNTTIGVTSSKAFSGNFDGQGHTVTIAQSLTNPDGLGGLFSFVRTPASGTVTIKDVHVTGTITATNTATGMGYFGGLISAVDGNTSGTGGTVNITNVWNSLTINLGLNNLWYGVGGYIGFIRHADGLKPLTVNFEGCYWDGVINSGPAMYYCGGFVGYTGNNKAGRTLTINIENSVANGTIRSNSTWNQYFGMLVGYMRNGNSDAATAKPILNVSNVVSIGNMTFSKDTGSESLIGLIDAVNTENSNYEVNLTNLYYYELERKGVSGDFPVLAQGTATSSTNVASKTVVQMANLTGSAFTDASKWDLSHTGYPCPAEIVTTFGYPEALVLTEYDITDVFPIATGADLVAIANDVNSGTHDYSGKIVRLTGNINLSGIAWQSIGDRSAGKPFRGTFDGGYVDNEGNNKTYTISNLTSTVEAGCTGALFGYVDGATIKNFSLNGRITITESVEYGFFASVANCVKGTVTIDTVRSSVYMTTSEGGISMYYVGGLVGFMENNTAVDLTMNRCVFDGVINCRGQARNVAGLFSYTGLNASGGAKTLTMKNSIFSGQIYLNDPGYYFGNAGLIGYLRGDAAGLVVNVNNSLSVGKINFNKNKTWSADYNDSCGVLVGYYYDIGGSDITLTVSNVWYTDMTIGTGDAQTTLAEVGQIERPKETSVYKQEFGSATNNARVRTDKQLHDAALTLFTAAERSNWETAVASTPYITNFIHLTCFPQSACCRVLMQASATTEARNTSDNYKGIRFVATYYNTAICTGGGTKSANFGILIVPADKYSETMTYSDLKSVGAFDIPAVKVETLDSGSYKVRAVLYNIPDGNKDTQLVAIPYINTTLGDASVATTYNALFN